LTYGILIILITGVLSSFFLPELKTMEWYINLIDWEVVFFLIGMFTIVEILNDKKVFQEISKRIVLKYRTNIRKMFYIICIVSTLTASILEDLSVAMIFGPIIIIACRELKISPTPFLLAMTICINLAATLTPFGSIQNVIIANSFNLDLFYFFKNFLPYFLFSTFFTLVLLDKFMLQRNLKKDLEVKEQENKNTRLENVPKTKKKILYLHKPLEEKNISEIVVDKKVVQKNLVGLFIFVVLLIIIPNLHIPCLISTLIFIFINPVKGADGKSHASISHYFKKVNYKLIYFFICLFILVGMMEINGSLTILNSLIESTSNHGIFNLCISILLITSIVSGFMDNAPVTIIFIPIIHNLIDLPAFSMYSVPIIFAFILGINVGGNFLPQGSACDMMTLEIAKENNVKDLTYKKLFKIGGAFALIHVIIAIGFIALMIFV
jgi:Na+/H+ antiporter NhaD/arsenite permease-like protein